ncbi:DUF4262 domain-containing protein [Frankia sp. AgB1.9]|uniref:DUF4262 domain-containing protein n=1 Tax=unclassified Frankia TaxID=2632575 RepID=UPI001934A9EE|nr:MULTISPECIES: DUF4262 domain-containing protein [unclassified Frankia]MBL7490880.1 DUF4262 domain-containing protein [Frankia sp. AgW1.1]MBL7550932.1 DUF4262 domain-containing protein [Frankia sp. AgB1.9]MBL7624441.1 DUF4262 domain-containing protein [Frankia sp. AgB1.8]
MTTTRDPGPRPHPRPTTTFPSPERRPAGGAGRPVQLVDPERLLDELCEQFETRYDALIDEAIAIHGWALQTAPAHHGRPRLAYTVGLTAHDGHPELIITGLRSNVAARILNVLCDHVRDGQRLGTRQQCADFPGWPRLALLDVDPDNSADLLVAANRRYQPTDGPPVDALQVVWCDPAGNLPWEPGWVLPQDAQPVLHYPLDPFVDLDDEDDEEREDETGPGVEGRRDSLHGEQEDDVTPPPIRIG